MNAGNIVVPHGQDHPPRQRSQRLAFGASALIVAATLASCSTASQDPGDDTPTASSSIEQEAPSHPETQTQAETGAPSSNSTDEQATDPADQDGGETSTGSESDESADPGESAETDDSDTGTTDSTPPAPSGTSTDGLDDMVTPPGFSEPDSVLQEDAFDGPNLRLESLTIDDASQEDAVSVSFNVEGSGFPGWQVEYVDGDASPFGSETQSTLRVVLPGVNPDSVDAVSFPESDLIEVQAGEPTDGDLTVFLGIASEPVPFRVHLQYSPLRLMVDLSAAGS